MLDLSPGYWLYVGLILVIPWCVLTWKNNPLGIIYPTKILPPTSIRSKYGVQERPSSFAGSVNLTSRENSTAPLPVVTWPPKPRATYGPKPSIKYPLPHGFLYTRFKGISRYDSRVVVFVSPTPLDPLLIMRNPVWKWKSELTGMLISIPKWAPGSKWFFWMRPSKSLSSNFWRLAPLLTAIDTLSESTRWDLASEAVNTRASVRVNILSLNYVFFLSQAVVYISYY